MQDHRPRPIKERRQRHLALATCQRLFDDQSSIGRAGALTSRAAVAALGRSPLRELLTYQYIVVARRAR